jgi:MFS family permease
MIVGLLLLAIVNTTSFLVDLFLIGLAGVTVIGFFVSLFTLLQESSADAYRGRIFGTFGMVQALTMLLGMGLASTLGDSIGIVPVLDIAAGCDFFAGVLAFLVVRHMSQPKQPEGIEYPLSSEAFEEKKVAL